MSRADRLLAMLPVSEATVQRLAAWTIVGLILAILGGVALFLGLPAMAGSKFAETAAHAGFQVEKVEVHGIEHMDEMQVYNIALGQVDRSMVGLDLGRLHEEMMKIGWVKDARVSRRLPDTLVVDIVERQPAAVWQNGGKLALIDVAGHVLDTVDVGQMPDLPLVIGPDANRQTEALARLFEAAPALKPVLAGATWVGNRRWNLRFQSGETLLLPEGEKFSQEALVSFARMDGVNRLLGRGIVRFDMRDRTRMVLRLPPDRKKPAAATPASGDAKTDKLVATSKSEEG
jgi:cell division protein FtsQ